MKPITIKSIGTVVAGVLAAVAAADTFPMFTALLAAVAGVLLGWLHLPQPGTVKAPVP